MPAVTFDIPNIGKVVAENAASEDTLIKILDAVKKSEKAKKAEEKKSNLDAQKAMDTSTKGAQKAGSALDSLGKDADGTGKSLKGVGEDAKEGGSKAKKAADQLSGGFKNLSLTAVSLAAQFASSYEQMAKDPIGAAAGLINTGIDLAASGAKALTSWVPILGTAAAATADLAAALAKTANDIFAAEFKKSADELRDYTKAGASFAGGMLEMRTTAHNAGVNMLVFSKAAAASAEDFRNMGLSQGEGVKKLAAGMKATTEITGKSGRTMRDQMLALGYSYEEQGSIMAQYMSQQKASGQLQTMTTADVARGTKEYATNLKVLTDITGQDAKKLMEKARLETMRGALMNKLQGDQQTAFKGAYATLSKYGPEVQQALIQQLTGGVITSQAIAANADLVEMVQSVAGQVQSGNTDIINTTVKSMAEAREKIGKNAGTEILDQAAILSNGGAALATTISNINNSILQSGMTPDMAETSKKAATKQSESVDGVTAGFIAVTKATTNLATMMETVVTDKLGLYAKSIGTAMDASVKAFTDGAAAIQAVIDTTHSMMTKTVATPATPTPEEFNVTPGGAATVNPNMMRKYAKARESAQARMGKANGGIATGPTSGYLEKLHGTEAVVPLPDGKSIPVDMNMDGVIAAIMSKLPDSEDLSGLLRDLIRKQDDLIRVMEDNRDYTQRLMNNMS